jgi:hypothetical protein
MEHSCNSSSLLHSVAGVPYPAMGAGLVRHCAHRPSTFLLCAVCEHSFTLYVFLYLLHSVAGVPIPQGCGVGPSLRASNEHILIVRVARANGTTPHTLPLPLHTGHSSSFHAISQNIHSYRELIMNASSIRFFSACPASFTHPFTFARIHLCTSANSGEA